MNAQRKTKTAATSVVQLDITTRSAEELAFEKWLDERFEGQPEAKAMLMDAYRVTLSPLRADGEPAFFAMQLGPSRTGKSFGPELLAEYIHGSRKRLRRINLSIYKSKYQISQLIGASAMYVGYDDPPMLGRTKLEQSRGPSKKWPIILVLEEADKCAEEVEDILMGIADKGHQELANGEDVDYSDVLIFMTSNLGMKQLQRNPMGFGHERPRSRPSKQDVESAAKEALRNRYNPEFINRFHAIVIYEPLTREQVRSIVDKEVAHFADSLMDRMPRGSIFGVEVDDLACDFLFEKAEAAAEEGTGSPVAELKRMIRRYLSRPIEGELIKGTIALGDLVKVTHQDGADALSFENHKGVAHVSAADKLVIDRKDTRDNQQGLARQRRDSLAIQGAKKSGLSEWDVVVTTKKLDGLFEEYRALVHDMREIYGIEVLETKNTWKPPFVFTARVRASEGQISRLKSAWESIQVIEVEPTTKK